MLSLYAEIFLSFLCFTQTKTVNVMNCFALKPLPPEISYMKFFREQIELQVAPCYLIDPRNFHIFFL